jgi:hypothetical protein
MSRHVVGALGTNDCQHWSLCGLHNRYLLMSVEGLSLWSLGWSNSVESITHVFTNIRVPYIIRILELGYDGKFNKTLDLQFSFKLRAQLVC